LQEDKRVKEAAVQMEYNVLSMHCVQNFSQCSEMLVEALATDKDTQDIAWHLIKLLRDRGHPHDAQRHSRT